MNYFVLHAGFILITAGLFLVCWSAAWVPIYRRLSFGRKFSELSLLVVQASIVLILVKLTSDYFRTDAVFIEDRAFAYAVLPVEVFSFFAEVLNYPFLRKAIGIAGAVSLLAFAIIRFTDTLIAQFAYGLAAVVFCSTGLWLAADMTFRAQMDALAAREIDCHERVSFLRSVALSQQFIKPEFHLLAYKDGEPFAWSFRRFELLSLGGDDEWKNGPGIGLFTRCYGYDPRRRGATKSELNSNEEGG
ncbi:hypothetical protein [Oricola sp.]|uniref:hypothetical protein n=1 Tax=Oricola sp. TaxID=1979950 RepID=UPI0025CBB336|nr:hypothetical protein [Oricola sp.]MCI5074622.1 hypothetical protein [Oricola sp.]